MRFLVFLERQGLNYTEVLTNRQSRTQLGRKSRNRKWNSIIDETRDSLGS